MSRYKAYPEYKDSGIEWLGQAPTHWTTVPIKYMALEKDSLFLDGDWIESKDLSEDGIRYITTGNIGEGKYKEQGAGYITEDKFQKLGCTEIFEGDLLISRLNVPIGRACIVPNLEAKIVTSVDNVIFRPDHQYSKSYLVYLFTSGHYFKHTENLARGTTMQRISRGLLGNVRIIVPSHEEQIQIANFLDHETARIDTLIEKQQQLIKLLKEKRQAVVSHAVTKGLNPNAPVRDSGVEWLGEVPKHWRVMPLKYIIKAKKGAVKAGPFGSHLKNSDMEGKDIKVISQKNIISKDFEIGESMISIDKYRELEVFTIERNDILVTTRGTIGKTAIYDRDTIAILHPCVIRIQIEGSQVYPELVALIIQESGYAMEQILINSNATTIEVIYSENLINTIICVPPTLSEQKLFLIYIRSKKTYFKGLIKKAESAIELMQERRTALISAAVTGKIDVRNWQPPKARHSSKKINKECNA
ncbi:MAG: restriction endonuclease subunit S [Gammaproteobacteria bacterium]